jgi:hypothetical protein
MRLMRWLLNLKNRVIKKWCGILFRVNLRINDEKIYINFT